jgi:hypothetical protein
LPGDGQLLGESEAVEAENSHLDPQLQLLIQAWPTLPSAIREAILAMPRAGK